MEPEPGQHLSRLLDDELTEFERRRLLAEILESESDLHRLARYQLIGEAVRQQSNEPLLRPEFAARVSAAIEQESIAPDSGMSIPSGWKRVTASLAIAASVAMMSIYLAPRLLNPTEDNLDSPVEVAEVAPQQEGEGTYWRTLPPEVERKLNRYLVDHGEHAAGRGMDRMLPYATFVSYDSNH